MKISFKRSVSTKSVACGIISIWGTGDRVKETVNRRPFVSNDTEEDSLKRRPLEPNELSRVIRGPMTTSPVFIHNRRGSLKELNN